MESEIQNQHMETIKNKITERLKLSQVMLIVLFIVVLYLIIRVVNLSNQIESLVNEVKQLNPPVIADVLSDEEVLVEVPVEDPLVSINRRIDAIVSSNRILEFEFDMSNAGIVTDNFYTAKLTAYDLPVFESFGGLSMYINLDNQPSMSSKYKGQGNFDVPDRELKAMLLEVIERLKKEWESANKFRYLSDEEKENANKFEDGTYYLSVKGFDVATMEKGILKLKGE